MSPILFSVLIFAIAVLGGITLYQGVFGGQGDIGDRLSAETGTQRGPRLGALNADRLLRWNMRRLRETRAKNPADQKLPDTLTRAGFRGIESIARFQLGRFAIMGAAGLVGLIVCLALGHAWLIGGMGGSVLGYIIPTVVVGRIARARKRRMTHELPDVLSLMVVSLEAGISVSEVLRLVGRETERQGRLLGRELTLTAAQMSAGMSFEETLKDFGTRTGVDEIKSLAALLIQSEKIGARLGPALRASAELLNSRRRMGAEEAARKTSVKMLFPLVFFILPAMLLIILGPAVIQIMGVFRHQ
jgi:tight adherence protein C